MGAVGGVKLRAVQIRRTARMILKEEAERTKKIIVPPELP
jgi:hypothetical protein